MVMCGVCDNAMKNTKHPVVGTSIKCVYCGAVGYGTYDDTEEMNYMVEWYTKDDDD